MCGICLILYSNSVVDFNSSLCIRNNSRLGNRGPDGECIKTRVMCENTTAMFAGHVLHLRGDTMACQPAEDPNGNLLLWNGEIFGGINVPESESDTKVLLDLLCNCSSDTEITSLLAQIQGPWSLIYFQACTNTVWFGRDVFGRRSLLWHLPEDCSEEFILSSVQIKPWAFREVPSVGLFKMSGTDTKEILLFPWNSAVWPGSLDLVQDTQDLSARMYSGIEPQSVKFKMSQDISIPSQMPALNKALPPEDYSIQSLEPDTSHIDYLQTTLQSNSYLRTLSRQLTGVLLEAVRTRVLEQNSRQPELGNKEMNTKESSQSILTGFDNSCAINSTAEASCDSHLTSSAKVAVLFSGGIDSTMIAALADRCVPEGETIDLLNVAFELKPKAPCNTKKQKPTVIPVEKKWDVPDRLTGYSALSELNPDRLWNFIEVNVTAEELQEARTAHIHELVYPLQTVLDDSIGCAVWFASRGCGILGNGPHKGTNIQSTARVILCGMGADEQLVGYSRHRVRFKEEGWIGLVNEIELEVTRISSRNLGRDDRIITDHGKESRFPFLDERVVQFLSSLPVHSKADLTLPRGLGEKLLLRLSATELGLHQTATLAKRAIQFGSRIAKLENNKEKASDVCTRLTNVKVSKPETL